MGSQDVLVETMRVLSEELGNQSAAARRLGIPRNTFRERAQQALWFVHPTNGIVSQQAVYCEAPPEQTSHEWVSWAGATV